MIRTRSSRSRRHPSRARGRLAWLPALLLTFSLPHMGEAAETRWWTTASASDYENAESDGVVVDADGVITLGPSAEFTTIDSADVVWCAAVRGDGRVALGADGGRVFLAGRGRSAAQWVTLPVGQVLSLLADGDDIIAGTGPEGLVYRIRANGDTSRIASTDERYVWALVPAGRDGWFAATGTNGRIVRIDRDGQTRVALDTEAGNIVALITDGKGGAYAGTDTDGRVIHLRSNGSARTLFDAEEDEIRALALDDDGALFAAALSASAVQNTNGEDADAKPRPARRPATRQTARVYRIVADSIAAERWSSPHPSVFALARTSQGIAVATGNRAGLFMLDGPGRASQWLSVPQGQITSLAQSADGTLFAATSSPAGLWEIRPGEGRSGELRSSVLDAKRLSRFGLIRWFGDAAGARVEVETRSGNGATPDTTWSRWSGASTPEQGRRVDAPPARYLQWRLKLTGGQPRIESVEVSWREHNAAPAVHGLRIAPQSEGFREGRLSTRTEPVTQELPDGRKVEFSLKRKSDEKNLSGLPLWVQGLRNVHWSADDPNEDPLRYRVEVRREGEADWLPIVRDLRDSVYVWDTKAVGDGRYRLRVTASDIEANAVGEERESWTISPLITVDNTAPTITSLDVSGHAGSVRVRGAAADPGTIARIEAAIDTGEWRTITPVGGLADSERPSFTATIEGIAPGAHAVSVRVVDRAGNHVVRAARATVTR